MNFSEAFASHLPGEAAQSFREAVAAWRALSPEAKAVEIARIEQADRALAERDRESKKLARRDRLRALSGVESRFRSATLDLDWSGNDLARTAAFGALETRKGWFYGPIGVGKTHIAAALVNDTVAHDTEAVLISGLTILARIKASYDDSGIVKPECVDIVNRLAGVPVLAIDDLGKERFTAWAAEQFYLLIDARYLKKLPLIVTSNFTPKELEKHWSATGMDDSYGPALVRRIAAMTGNPVQVFGRRAR